MLAEAAKSSAAEMAASELLTREPIDEDTMEDVLQLAEASEAGFLDVQADDATAIAALTSDGEAIPSPFVALSLTFHS